MVEIRAISMAVICFENLDSIIIRVTGQAFYYFFRSFREPLQIIEQGPSQKERKNIKLFSYLPGFEYDLVLNFRLL